MADFLIEDKALGTGFDAIIFNRKPILKCTFKEAFKASRMIFTSKEMGFWNAYHARQDFLKEWNNRKEQK